MSQIICAKIGKYYLLVDNQTYKTLKVPKELYNLLKNIIKNNELIPKDISEVISAKLETNLSFARESFFFKKDDGGLYAASYEITNKCNFKCLHCMIDKETYDELNIERQRQIIKFINNTDCLWLQITGGEPLLSKNFEQIYALAHSLHMLITVSTNGSILHKYNELFTKHSPYEIAISLYGATPETYKKMTGAKENYLNVLKSLESVKKESLRAKINIILTKYNQGEIELMKKIAKYYGLPYHIYDKISPGISGSYEQLLCNIKHNPNSFVEVKEKTECNAEMNFFHVNSN